MFNVTNVSSQATGLYVYILKVSQLKITEMSKGMFNISWSYKEGIIQVSARRCYILHYMSFSNHLISFYICNC